MAGKGPRRTDGFDLSQTLSHLLRVCCQQANDLFAQEPGAGELTKPQFTVLSAVEQHEGISQTELVALTKIDRSTLAEMMLRMIQKGMVHRERTEEDARANAVRMTNAGKRALRTARGANERVERALGAALSPADRVKLVKLLTAINVHLDASEGKNPRARRKTPR